MTKPKPTLETPATRSAARCVSTALSPKSPENVFIRHVLSSAIQGAFAIQLANFTKNSKKVAYKFAYVIFLLYLCSRKGFRTMNDYRFINIDEEPTEEQLAQLMREVAEEAKKRYEKARAAYFAQIDQLMCAL